MTWHLAVENVAGIREGETRIEPGPNAVRGSNWQGKSSMIAAVETAMGTARTLTEGEDRGRVELETPSGTTTIGLVRENGGVKRRGDPFLDDAGDRAAADLYAFLGEDNEVRRAVREGENLEAVLTRPLDFENIDERIARLTAERDRVDRELSAAEEAARELPGVEERVAEAEKRVEALRERRAELTDGDGGGVTEAREELSSAIAEREDVEARIERLERAVERTGGKLEGRREELSSLEVPADEEDLATRLEEARQRYERTEADAELLQSVYAPTKRLVDEGRLDLITDVERDLVADAVTCWTCGEETTREAVEANLERLSERVTELRESAREHRETVDELEDRLEDRREAERRREKLEREVADLRDTLAERETSLAAARERSDELDDRIDELEATVEDAGDRLTDVEGDLKYERSRLEDLREEREELASEADRREQLREERADLTEAITDLRTRKEATKRRAREEFESAMTDVVERFDTGFETARLTADFEVVVARDGREAPLDALSEGEVELIGLVAALAGHEAFDVADTVPVMLVDDLGGLADDNLRTLVEFLTDRADYLVFTAYPENSPIESNTIDPGDWDVVSPPTS